MRFSLEKKIIFIVAAFALVSLLIIFTIIWPTIIRIKELDRETYELRVYLEKRYERSLNQRSTLRRLDEIKLAVQGFPDHIFNAGEELRLITTLEGIAAKNKVAQRITGSNVDKITNQSLKISLTITGDYTRVLSYLTDIENLDYFLTVQQLQLSASIDPVSHAETTSMNLDVSMYVVN
ncbi:MAG: hypothetical protein A2754_03060 [Candidatus Magasanikbacteria bacterium RIFCSPHIGHO2_01_FULL_47_8]|uniref:Uncharacterized protein n=1 Tax=Candidatus Magasanikbacteria bacterium RIFCSPHIGHO2_01_FULL_47_8 TaxID=1798673 RepID=A0A1F6MDE9_9BACT|nr:MAG: hypothetical protein A2754_03060 [Candidatus Magasanikbacteria bacterium RIFCSPHIGHO2_01_FULL_47_8]